MCCSCENHIVRNWQLENSSGAFAGCFVAVCHFGMWLHSSLPQQKDTNSGSVGFWSHYAHISSGGSNPPHNQIQTRHLAHSFFMCLLWQIYLWIDSKIKFDATALLLALQVEICSLKSALVMGEHFVKLRSLMIIMIKQQRFQHCSAYQILADLDSFRIV